MNIIQVEVLVHSKDHIGLERWKYGWTQPSIHKSWNDSSGASFGPPNTNSSEVPPGDYAGPAMAGKGQRIDLVGPSSVQNGRQQGWVEEAIAHLCAKNKLKCWIPQKNKIRCLVLEILDAAGAPSTYDPKVLFINWTFLFLIFCFLYSRLWRINMDLIMRSTLLPDTCWALVCKK